MLLLIICQALLKLMHNLLPMKMVRKRVKLRTVSIDEPLRALAFKIMDDRFGALTFVRYLFWRA
jgi:hypothetical protein